MSYLDDILNDYMIEDWFDTQQYSQGTKERYGLALRTYTEITRLNPEQLILEAEEDIKEGKLPRERRIKQHMVKFRKNLQNNGYADKSIETYMAAVKSFYRNFDIDLPNTGKGSRNLKLVHDKYVPTRETIQEILELSTLRNKAIVLCGCSAGLSVNEIVNLRVGQFKKGYDPDTEITTLHVHRTKVHYDYITFLSPEASRAVKRYLEWRERDCDRTGGPYRKHTEMGRKVYDDDNFLFISDTAGRKFQESGDETDRQMNTRMVMDFYQRLNLHEGHKAGKWRDIRSHNMRKYFNTTLLNAGADIFFVDFLMGHKISGTHEAYYRADPEALKKKYIKYLPFLAIEDTEVHTIESEEYRMLREENEQMKKEFEQLKSSMRHEFAQMVDAKVDARIKRGMSGIGD